LSARIARMDRHLIFTRHAVERMLQWNVSYEDIEHAVDNGIAIAYYPHDKPYPSRLLSHKARGRELHVVIAENFDENEVIIVTVYQPDEDYYLRKRGRRKQ